MGLGHVIGTMAAVDSVTADELVDQYGEIDVALKVLEKRKEAMRARVIKLASGLGVKEIVSSSGARLVLTPTAGANRVDSKKARALLDEETLKKITTMGAPSVSVSYKAPGWVAELDS